MRLKVRLSDGSSHVVSFEGTTVSDLIAACTSLTSDKISGIRAGFPPKPIDLAGTLVGQGIRSGDQITLSTTEQGTEEPQTIVKPPSSIPGSSSSKQSFKPPSKPSSEPAKSTQDAPVVPCGDQFLKLRVMEDDNSCLFASVGYDILRSAQSMFELRTIVAQTIAENPEEYSDAILGKPRDQYQQWILRETSWGGAIELAILSKYFNVTICCLDVSTLQLHHFNPGQPVFICVVYSGIHYDAVALSPLQEDGPAEAQELDTMVFGYDEMGAAVLDSLLELGRQLKQKHYYTDTASFQLRCNTCGTNLTGEKHATQHAMSTGHTDFGEV